MFTVRPKPDDQILPLDPIYILWNTCLVYTGNAISNAIYQAYYLFTCYLFGLNVIFGHMVFHLFGPMVEY